MTEQGPVLDPHRLRSAVDDYVHRSEPDSLAGREDRAHRNRRLTISRTAGGGVAGEFSLDPVAGETLLTAVAAHAAPAGADDHRTPEQRRADALVTIAKHTLDSGRAPMVGGVRPHVTVVVPADTLQQSAGAPPARLDRLGALSATAARRLTCDPTLTRVTTTTAASAPVHGRATGIAAGGSPAQGGGRGSPGTTTDGSQPDNSDATFIRIITAGASQPLDVGRASRVVSVAQRRALAVRDQGCIGCKAPVGWCEAHHVQHWVDGGPTDLDNLVLVCWRCHRDIHHAGKTPTRQADGRWTLQRRAHDPP